LCREVDRMTVPATCRVIMSFLSPGKKESEVKNNEDHKKGHSTKGYQNYHHKDESSKSTTFFDESNDEGGHYDYQGQQGAFGGEGGSSFKGALQDGGFASDAKGKQGHYNSGYATDKQHGAKGSQSNQEYYGDNEGYGQKKAFDDFGNRAALEHQQGYGGYHGQQYGGFKKGGNYGGYGGGLGGHLGYVGY